MFSQCYVDTYKNPFTSDILTIGLKDDLQIFDFFEIDKVPMAVRAMPQFIHIDASLTGDKTGISDVAASGVKESMLYDGANETLVTEMTYKHVFSVAIQAPTGTEISFEKTRKFIYYLRSNGFNIVGVSLDGFQSADTKQTLITQGYDATIISLDRSPDGYHALRSAMNDKRVALIQIDLLENELIQLQRDVKTGKLDHPTDGSKDLSDSLAGALFNATLHKDNLIDNMQLLNVATDINEYISPEQEFMDDMQQSLSARNYNKMQATDKLNELLNSFNDPNILVW
jgi:hypothetical protein